MKNPGQPSTTPHYADSCRSRQASAAGQPDEFIKPQYKAAANELGVLSRHWRDVRGRSQLDLSIDMGVSRRHISFIEGGRSVPSRQTLMDIAQALDIPLRDRNTLLKMI